MANTSHRDVEIQSPTTLKSEEYRQLFRLPPEEKIIAFNEIKSFKKAKTAGIFSNAIEIFAGGRKFFYLTLLVDFTWHYFFTSFISRDEAFKLINDGWVQHGNGGNEITEQQELMLESCSKENGFVAIEKVNSFKTLINDMESRDGGEDVSTTNNFKVPSTFENDTEVGLESIISTNYSTPTDTCFFVPENCDAPKVPDYFIKVAETKFPVVNCELISYKFFHMRSFSISDNAINFIKSFHRRRGDKEFKCSSWCLHDKFGHVRDVSYQHTCKESQKFQIYRNSHWVLETSQEVNDVPYGDYFRVEGFWDVERDSDGPVEGCISRVYVNVAFNKKTVWKGKIVKSTLEECQEAYATWLDMARELLKQNIDKQGGVDPSGSSTENGEHQIENKVATIEKPLERSQNLSDPVRTLQMSTFMDASIVVLLKKPQQVLVRYPVTYMSSVGGGASERQAEAVAWLEKQIHELKEQMAMVESLLERMRHEHAALKAQLKQLG
ncbi:hypothetical protein ES319_A12G103100v1 [Gossypium barbadense]|uniref:VASt domain-containing protein n=1 Tax=Gossypium barbadense TaxID=3634 RepID=A0A5J5T929_GOSBA|nr:hypothetical protein ES319_A12G103100v1 [Gossypium barbadense]